MMEKPKKGPPILADASKCAGCLVCQLRCSFRFEKEFNPSKAAITIRRLVDGENEYEISFTDRCDNCGICVRHCPYGALMFEEEKRAFA
jgi:ferredoxin